MSIITASEFFRKYGTVEVKFSSYYKYTFTYHAILADGKRLIAQIGGDSSEIYKLEVTADTKIPVNNLSLVFGAVYDGNKMVESFSEFD